jgi:catechol 2,3-dioxygenase-like lactoylglutathione lyase family enzyme
LINHLFTLILGINGEKSMLIDHIGIAISDYHRSKVFYSKVLQPLGIELVAEVDGWAGFGKHGKGDFWLGVDEKIQFPMHIAFLAASREEVNQFYAAAIAAGAKDNGKPGLRVKYHADYYAAFVFDPDGHNIEAVCHLADDRMNTKIT